MMMERIRERRLRAVRTVTDRIRERRAALAAQFEHAQQQHAQLLQTLHELDRQLCAMQGGLQELDALLGEPCDTPPPS